MLSDDNFAIKSSMVFCKISDHEKSKASQKRIMSHRRLYGDKIQANTQNSNINLHHTQLSASLNNHLQSKKHAVCVHESDM